MVESIWMNWHYESGGQALGPVGEEHVLSLRAMGVIGAGDRVRREDWPDWREAGEVWPMSLPLHVPASSTPSPAVDGPCVECGSHDPRGALLGGFPVCPACTPLAREKQWQGLPLGGGPWRDGNILIIRDDLPLPNCCVKCAEPATTRLKKRLTWHHPAVYLALIPGVLPYLVFALIFRRTLTVDFPLCAPCARRRRRNIAVLLLSFLAFAALLSIALTALRLHEIQATAWFIASAVLMLFTFVWGLVIQIGVAERIDERYARLTKVGQPFLNRMPRWPYG